MAVKFIQAKTPKDIALQTMLRVLGIIRYGGTITPEDAQVFINLCSLALPMRYRLPRACWEEIERGVTLTLQERKEKIDASKKN